MLTISAIALRWLERQEAPLPQR